MMYYAKGNKAPTEKQLRNEMELPHECKFLGWAVHTPLEDGFLIKNSDTSGASVRVFGGDIEKAFKFKVPKVAARIIDELHYPAVLTALFDLGTQIASVPVGGNGFSEFRRSPSAAETNQT